MRRQVLDKLIQAVKDHLVDGYDWRAFKYLDPYGQWLDNEVIGDLLQRDRKLEDALTDAMHESQNDRD